MGSQESTSTSLDNEELEFEELYTFKPFIYEIQVYEKGDTPYPRSGHRIVCDEDNFYSYGGYNPVRSILALNGQANVTGVDEDMLALFPDLWKFNYASMKWKRLQVKEIPFALASNAVLLSGKILMVYGGTGVPFHLARSNDLYICNLAESDLKFKKVEVTGQVPPPLYGQAVFIKDNYFYAIGGTSGFDYFTDIHRLDLVTSKWEEVYIYKGMRNEPTGRYRHELAVVGDKVYILGGGIGTEACDFEKIPVFDLIQRTWDIVLTVRDSIHGYPSPRQYHSAVNIPGTSSFVMVGGIHGSSVLDDAWRFDVPSLKWRNINSLRLCTPVYFHASSVTPSGKMYTFGGVSKNFGNIERVSHVQSAWICIPKLKDICWEAIVDYGLIDEAFNNTGKNTLPAEYYKKLIV